MKNFILLLSASLILTGCVLQNNPVIPVNSASPTVVFSPVSPGSPLFSPTPVGAAPTATVNPGQVTNTPAPSGQVSSSPVTIPTPVASSTNGKQFIIGIDRGFERATQNNPPDAANETKDTLEDLVNLNASFAIVDFRQNIVDPDRDGEKLNFHIYNEILEGLLNKNISIILKVSHDRILYGDSTKDAEFTPVKNYITFLEDSQEHFKDFDISWIFGEEVNNRNARPGSQNDFVEFLAISANTVRRVSPKVPVYMGSFIQSEVFGEKHYFTAENLLSYLNLGVDKYTDGYIFEIYSIAFNDTKDINAQTLFKGSDYKLVKTYYDSINEILKQKKIENKKLFLVTSSYENTLINELSQSEEQQANDLLRRLIFGITTGWDRVYLPELSDKIYGQDSDFFQRRGLLLDYLEQNRNKKLSYWAFKFLAEKLKDSYYKEPMVNLPGHMEGFIFENRNAVPARKKYYVFWNNDENFKGNISLSLTGKNARFYISPNPSNQFGINLAINPDDTGIYNISFNSSPQNLRIVEVTE